MSNSVFARVGRRGAVTLEFGLVVVPFLTLLLAGIEMGRYLYTVDALSHHAETTLRATVVYVSNDPSNRCLANLSNVITRPSLPVGLSTGQLTLAQPSCLLDSSSKVITVTVSASYRFNFASGLLGLADQRIDRVVQQAL